MPPPGQPPTKPPGQLRVHQKFHAAKAFHPLDVCQPRSVSQCGQNILTLKIFIISQYFICRHPPGQQLQQTLDGISLVREYTACRGKSRVCVIRSEWLIPAPLVLDGSVIPANDNASLIPMLGKMAGAITVTPFIAHDFEVTETEHCP